ncbi:MAG: rhodanese-like domain-containing protein [Chlorobi bacterium]|nr:rhodanese-like domain-containing protein [Chlorobiota bacterium]
MKKILLLLITLSIFFSCKSQTKEEVKDTKTVQTKEIVQAKDPIQLLDVAAFKKGITNPEIQLIDVRTPKEYEGGHIENATLIDYFSSNFKETLLTLDKEKPLYLYCKSGGRSRKAAKILAEMGFKEIYDLKGGYMAWEKQ